MADHHEGAGAWGHRQILVLDGDGNLLENLASLADAANRRPTNLVHIVLDNGAYEGGAGLPFVIAGRTDLAIVARGAGIEDPRTVITLEDFDAAAHDAFDGPGHRLIVAKVDTGSVPDLPTQTIDGHEQKYRFVPLHRAHRRHCRAASSLHAPLAARAYNAPRAAVRVKPRTFSGPNHLGEKPHMTTDADIEDLKARVATACRVLARLDLTREPAGHVSARIPGTERILIKARGPGEAGVRYTQPEDIVEVDMNGKMLSSIEGFISPREVFIHTWLYRKRPEVNSVIHVHPPYVVSFTVVGRELLPIYGAYDPGSLRLWIDGIPLYDKSILINNDTLGEELAGVIGGKDVVLMRGHGITSVGTSVEAAGIHAIFVNELAVMNYKAALIGDPRPISDDDLESFTQMVNTGTVPVEGVVAWETYRRMVDD